MSGEVRLNDGSINSDKGRLEICARGEWGTVCSDRFDMNAARVVCRQLGVQENGELMTFFIPHACSIYSQMTCSIRDG